MGKPRFVCEYCNKSFEDSQEARRRHDRGRNHKANVKLWYDSFADQDHHAAAATLASHTSSRGDSADWVPVSQGPALPQERVELQNLPPSMIPAPPGVFYYCRTDWG